jgi:galactokinase
MSEVNLIDDLRPEKLGIADIKLLKMVSALPQSVEFSRLSQILGKKWDKLQDQFQFTNPPNHLKIQAVVLYGIAECIRSAQFLHLIQNKKLETAGQLMNISHNGDRIVQFDENFIAQPYQKPNSSTYIKEIKNYAKNDKNSFSLEYVSGGYGCSVKEIDFLIDLCKDNNGVVGAQIAGGGLGGSCIALVHKSFVDSLKKKIKKTYWNTFHKNCKLYESIPVNGISLF